MPCTSSVTPILRRLALCLSGSCRRHILQALAITLSIASLGIASCTETPDAGRVVATVNGEPITYGQLMDELERKHGPKALLKLVDEQLVADAAAQKGIALSQAERDAGLERAAARVGSMADLEARLKQSGIPMEAYRKEIDTETLMDRIAASEVKVTDEIATDLKAQGFHQLPVVTTDTDSWEGYRPNKIKAIIDQLINVDR